MWLAGIAFSFAYVQSNHAYGHLLNKDRGKKTLFSLQPAGHGYPVNTDTFYGSLCVRFNGFWLYLSGTELLNSSTFVETSLRLPNQWGPRRKEYSPWEVSECF